MEDATSPRVPLIVVAGRDGTAQVIEGLRAQGAVVDQMRTPNGCLRVATSVGPDAVFLPPGFPRRLAALLEQHPKSARASIAWLQPGATGGRPTPLSRLPPHGQPLHRAPT